MVAQKGFTLYGLEPEEPHFVQQCLEDLENELDKIDKDAKAAFSMAQRASPDYVNAEPFRLMFLRSDRFQPKDAARRIAGHF